MNRFKSKKDSSYLVIVLLFIYLFFAFTNVFFIPHSTVALYKSTAPSGLFNRRQSIQSNSSSGQINIITDKSFIDDDLLNKVKFLSLVFLVFLSGFGALRLKSVLIPLQICFLFNTRYSYLFFCRLRI